MKETIFRGLEAWEWVKNLPSIWQDMVEIDAGNHESIHTHGNSVITQISCTQLLTT